MHAIIGSGIAGIATFLNVQNPVIFDKARYPGGRMATKPIGNNSFCDIGATFFRNEPVEILKDGQSLFFSFGEWLASFGILSICYREDSGLNLSYVPGGMHTIPFTIFKYSRVDFSRELVCFQKLANERFLLRFLDGSEEEVDYLTITAPLPQALHFFPEGEEKSLWEEFLFPYNQYRKTLVAAGLYRNPGKASIAKLADLSQHSFLDKTRDAEYISLESFKKPSNNCELVFMIQYSAEFSERNFDNWRNVDRTPTDFCKSKFLQDFRIFLREKNVPWYTEHEPDEWRIHKWRYAQAENALLGKTGVLNLDSPEFLKYEQLVSRTRIQITGDWLYGSRLERVAGGILLGRNRYG